MLTVHGRSRLRSVCGLMLCMLGLLAPVRIVAQSAAPTVPSEPNSAIGPKTQNAGSAALTQLDGCLTTSDGLMPKLTLFHSRRIYRLEAKPMLLTERPLLFANNVNALVHVTGYLGPLSRYLRSRSFPCFYCCHYRQVGAHLRRESAACSIEEAVREAAGCSSGRLILYGCSGQACGRRGHDRFIAGV